MYIQRQVKDATLFFLVFQEWKLYLLVFIRLRTDLSHIHVSPTHKNPLIIPSNSISISPRGQEVGTCFISTPTFKVILLIQIRVSSTEQCQLCLNIKLLLELLNVNAQILTVNMFVLIVPTIITVTLISLSIFDVI